MTKRVKGFTANYNEEPIGPEAVMEEEDMKETLNTFVEDLPISM